MAAVPSIGRATLVEAARVAPQAAATQGLYERHAAKIQSYCMHQLGSREEAEDAVQTTFMNAFRALGRGVVPEAESAWLFKIAENVCLSRRRSSWRRGRIESPSDFDVIEEIVPGPNRQRDELIGIEDALASMPEQQRRAILLREWQGLSYREIAAELEVSQSAVETLIFRARRSLAQGLEQPDSIKPAKRKSFRRAMRVIDLGTIAAVVKGLVAGSAAVKATAAAVAVTAAVGTAATVAPKQDSRTPASGLAAQAAPAATKPSRTPISFIPSAAPTTEQSSSVAVATPRAAAAQKPARAAGSGPARAPALPDAPATATPAASKPAQPSPAADQPKHDEPKHEATPRPTEPARADGNKNNEGKQGEGKQHGQGPEATPAPAEPAAVAPVASTPKRGGNSNGKDAPIVEAPLPVIAAAPALADNAKDQGSKQDRGRGNPMRELTSAATAAAAPAAVVEVPEPASAPAPDPAAEATAAPALDSTPVAEADDQGKGKRKVK